MSTRRILVFVLFAQSLLTLASCTQKFYPGPQTPDDKSPKAQKSLFSFQHEAVTEILISKNDLLTGDHWTTRIRRDSADSKDWQIALAPDGRTLVDRRADGNYILHLLDTLGTLGTNDAARSGAPDAFGLSPPLFAIRWTAPEGTFEIELGASDAKNNITYARLPATNQIFAVHGAALQMLSYLKTFDSLRYRQLSTWSSDDVDEVELRRGKKTLLYAQRDGSQWSDRKHRKVSMDVDSLLEGLTHARIKAFIDDETFVRKAAPRVTREPLYEAIFHDRNHRTDRLAIGASGTEGELLATASSRPNAVFALFPEASRLFMVQSR